MREGHDPTSATPQLGRILSLPASTCGLQRQLRPGVSRRPDQMPDRGATLETQARTASKICLGGLRLAPKISPRTWATDPPEPSVLTAA